MTTPAEAEIRALLEEHARAHREKSPEALAAFYAPDVRFFDLAPPLQHKGVDRAELEAWLRTWEGPIDVTFHDLEIEANAELAFATCLHRMTRRKTDGADIDLWFRAPACLRRRDERWEAVHVHSSVPFYMDGSFRAAVDLRP